MAKLEIYLIRSYVSFSKSTDQISYPKFNHRMKALGIHLDTSKDTEDKLSRLDLGGCRTLIQIKPNQLICTSNSCCHYIDYPSLEISSTVTFPSQQFFIANDKYLVCLSNSNQELIVHSKDGVQKASKLLPKKSKTNYYNGRWFGYHRYLKFYNENKVIVLLDDCTVWMIEIVEGQGEAQWSLIEQCLIDTEVGTQNPRRQGQLNEDFTTWNNYLYVIGNRGQLQVLDVERLPNRSVKIRDASPYLPDGSIFTAITCNKEYVVSAFSYKTQAESKGIQLGLCLYNRSLVKHLHLYLSEKEERPADYTENDLEYPPLQDMKIKTCHKIPFVLCLSIQRYFTVLAIFRSKLHMFSNLNKFTSTSSIAVVNLEYDDAFMAIHSSGRGACLFRISYK